MNTPFCDHHIAAFLSRYGAGKAPLDLALSVYFKTHKSLGSHDRKTIGDAVFGMVRWKTLLDHLCPSPDPLLRFRAFKALDFKKVLTNPSIPEAIRFGVPEVLFERLVRQYGEKKGKELCRILNTPAPTTIRANRLRTTREHLLELWSEYRPSACRIAPHGLSFPKRLPLFSFPEFKAGFFEVQDEGSQIVASLVSARPGDIVLDFCSGSGGKSLAIAPGVEGRGQIYLHDIRDSALLEAKKRLRRAGVQNAQFLPPGHGQLARLKGKCDWVLADVPCTGTGTLRRNPDQKWNLSEAMIQRLATEQKQIAEQALLYLKPGGTLVYATCSILAEENEFQVAGLLASSLLTLERPPLALLPEEGGMDGFFAAVFKKMDRMI